MYSKVDQLRALAERKDMQAIFMLLAKRERTRRDTTDIRLTRLLKDAGLVISRAQVRERLKELESLGLGAVVGDRRRGTRFQWKFDPISIGLVALKQSEHLKDVHIRGLVNQMVPHKVLKLGVGSTDRIIVRANGVSVEVSSSIDAKRLGDIVTAVKERRHA